MSLIIDVIISEGNMHYINKHLIRVALGKEPADLVIKGGKLVNVKTAEIYPADIAIADGRIAAVGDVEYTIRENTRIDEAQGAFLIPGLIDPHIHPEVTKLTLTKFSEAALSRGTTAIMTGLDQYGGVKGIDAMRFGLDEVKCTPMKVFHSGPSRLPYTTPASTVAFNFGVDDHHIVMDWEESVGMWEYMIGSIESLEPDVLQVADELIAMRKQPHGHLPFVRSGRRLNAAVAAGVADDHESASLEEVIDKLRLGVHVMLRKASIVDNIVDCIKVITEKGYPTQGVSLCTDDVDCTDLVRLGHMDHLVRHAIELGVDPLVAVQMCTINPAETYHVSHLVGMIAPGRYADILFVPDLTAFNIRRVYANGEIIVDESKAVKDFTSPEYPQSYKESMNIVDRVKEEDIFLTVAANAVEADVLVMQLHPSQKKLLREATLPVKGECIQPDPNEGINYISVTDRHSGKGKTTSAFFRGFGLRRGAFASSLSPDDNNVICIGASVSDMVVAINHLFDVGGGQVVCADGKIVEEIRLPVLGIMADMSAEEMAGKEEQMREALSRLGVDAPKPFFSMIFLSITAGPECAITDQGFVVYEKRDYVDPVLRWR